MTVYHDPATDDLLRALAGETVHTTMDTIVRVYIQGVVMGAANTVTAVSRNANSVLPDQDVLDGVVDYVTGLLTTRRGLDGALPGLRHILDPDTHPAVPRGWLPPEGPDRTAG